MKNETPRRFRNMVALSPLLSKGCAHGAHKANKRARAKAKSDLRREIG
ncbi:hypothetical protein [Sinimarinibacterium sp. NLF-5-8]|nr:hypothetical protein [Sinimarinibacterium sp. NLF-5-8]QHS09014.1 hypothetical protein GT972_01885 [Sinimarinibacterium sp. NLF-5-8]